MYFGNQKLILNGGVIGGGLMAPAHAARLKTEPDSYRLDWASKLRLCSCIVASMDFVTEAPNGDGTNYALYHFKEGSIDYFMYYVHVHNCVRGHIVRDQKFCDPYDTKYVHLHIKEGSGNSKDYLHYLPFFDPRIKITTNYGSTAYTGLNKGEPIPSGNSTNCETELAKCKTALKVAENRAVILQEQVELLKLSIDSFVPISNCYQKKQ